MLEVYGREGCGRCEMFKIELDDENIDYEYYDLDEIDNEEEIIEKAQSAGITSLPVIIQNQKIISKEEL